MKKDPIIFLDHALECIEIIEEYATGKSKTDFLESLQFQDSVIRRLEIIGEAVKNLPADFKEDHPGIQWRRIAGLRDVVVHKYFGIDLEVTWEIVKNDLPALKKNIRKILEGIKED
ncbi:MAG: DUF86 domain-containing protein [Candidatus Altiarchaeota archaeon]|nr:DUF86 domain-containing protein [Candidatus Altiarchaeota archaeon]